MLVGERCADVFTSRPLHADDGFRMTFALHRAQGRAGRNAAPLAGRHPVGVHADGAHGQLEWRHPGGDPGAAGRHRERDVRAAGFWALLVNADVGGAAFMATFAVPVITGRAIRPTTTTRPTTRRRGAERQASSRRRLRRRRRRASAEESFDAAAEAFCPRVTALPPCEPPDEVPAVDVSAFTTAVPVFAGERFAQPQADLPDLRSARPASARGPRSRRSGRSGRRCERAAACSKRST